MFVKHRGVALSPSTEEYNKGIKRSQLKRYRLYPEKFYAYEYPTDLSRRAWEVWRKERGLSEEEYDELGKMAGDLGIGVEEVYNIISAGRNAR